MSTVDGVHTREITPTHTDPTPPPSKVTATLSTEEALVAVIERDGLRLGTSEDAGRECVTRESPHGVNGEVYRWYVRTQGAPGPYQVRNPVTEQMVSARDDAGRELFDLGEVAAWNRSRPGPGVRNVPGRPVKWTQMRQDLLEAAQDGHLVRQVRVRMAGEELTPRQAQRLGELTAAGLIEVEELPEREVYQLTAAGQEWLVENARPAPG